MVIFHNHKTFQTWRWGPTPPSCVIHSSQLCDVEIYLNFIYLYILYTSSAISIFNQRNASMWLFRQTEDCFLQNDFVLGHFCTACCFVKMTLLKKGALSVKSFENIVKKYKSFENIVRKHKSFGDTIAGSETSQLYQNRKPWTPFTISVSRY